MAQLIRRRVHDFNADFYTNGPIEIPQEVFQEYARADGPNYSDPVIIFDGWTDENNPDDLRRCMIRDIVKQIKNNTYPYDNGILSCYYVTPLNLYEILTDGAGGIRGLRRLLRTRPKLRKELTEELLYVLKSETNDLTRPLEEHYQAAYNCVIQVVLSVTVDEALGRQLWDYHYLKFYGPKFDDLPGLFWLLTETAQMPTWLQAEVSASVAELLCRFTNSKDSTAILPGSKLFNARLDYWKVDTFFCNLFSHYVKGKYTEHDLCTILQLTEENLPANGTYLHQNFIIEALPALSDRLIALRVAKRHVNAYVADSQKRPATLDGLRTCTGRTFLYWLYGATNYHTPSDYDALQNISSLIALIDES